MISPCRLIEQAAIRSSIVLPFNKTVQIHQRPVLADERPDDTEVRARRKPDDLTFVIDSEPKTVRVIVKRIIHCPQVLHPFGRRLQERMRGYNSRHIRTAHNLAEVLDLVRHVPSSAT
jgi:hypothetical protein